MLRTVHLYGEAGRLFGRKFELDVESLAEAVRAIGVQIKGFRQYIEARYFQCVRGDTRKKGLELDENMVTFKLGSKDLHITPVIKGSGGGGGKGAAIGKIIAGILLAGFAFFVAPAMGIAAFGGVSMTQIGIMGIGLAIAGVSQLLSAQKKDDKKTESSFLDGNQRMAEQGMPVPLAYGRIMATGIPIISAGIHTEKVAI